MSIVKDFRYPVSLRWEEGRLTRASARNKSDLHVATPPEFKGGIAGVWSPEELLVTSVAACFAVTLVAIADRHRVRIFDLSVEGTGHVTELNDGRLGFAVIELNARIVTEEEHVAFVRNAAESAERGCLISRALDVPVHLEVDAVARPAHVAVVPG
jgi:organic hydroperoxide reductase OsmC/OhrA